MHDQKDSGEQAPVRRPRSAARTAAPGSGMAALIKIGLAAVALLLLAYYFGNRKPSPAADTAAATPQTEATAPASAAASSDSLVIQGEKSTTMANIDDAHMSVQEGGSVLRIEGSVGRNFATQMKALLDANPSVRRIDITSGGGYANPGLEAARLINRNNLTVRVRSHCASMCVALWAAAGNRQLEADAVIGLHQWNPQCDARPDEAERKECHYQVQFATEHNSSYNAWLRAAGFNQRLLNLQSQTASEDIAVLLAPQLWENGVDFTAVDSEGNRMSRDAVTQQLASKAARG
ncbi:hypothetical protein ABB27_14145 [Stenotrophomonas terrae]|uniref:Clp protease n=1 Tax=Stenotrophomonas terrae TaxID=405446 RepID=A0A0R0CA91_9GAMM|nr:hypothetical protein [Stenotrophomonas terrae]KRG66160.1 hypothetical protein ABB27_14145 [Stenotrophomonas terrae]